MSTTAHHSRLLVTSPNIVRDKGFRRRLNNAATAADEVYEVVRRAVEDDGKMVIEVQMADLKINLFLC